MNENALFLYRIISGQTPIVINGRTYMLSAPTSQQKLEAEELYEQIFYRYSFDDLISDDELYYFLVENGLWSEKQESTLNRLSDDLETLKVELYQCFFQSNRRNTIREGIARAKAEQNKLYSLRHNYDYLTPSGIANIAKLNYLIYSSLKLHPIEESAYVLNDIIAQYHNGRVPENKFREIARNEPWRSYWNAGKRESNIFGKPIIDFSEDQKTLYLWSILYDSVYESSDCPADSIVEDDDMLDGWLILQRRKRDNDRLNREQDQVIKNEKIRNASNVFIKADSPQDAAKVHDLNDALAKSIKKQREAMIQQGNVKMQDFADVKQELNMQMTQKMFSKKR